MEDSWKSRLLAFIQQERKLGKEVDVKNYNGTIYLKYDMFGMSLRFADQPSNDEDLYCVILGRLAILKDTYIDHETNRGKSICLN